MTSANRILDQGILDLCPLCERATFRAVPCTVCGKWWEQLGLLCPGNCRVEPPGLFLYKLAVAASVSGESLTLLDVGGGGGAVGYDTWPSIGVRFHAVLDLCAPLTPVPNFTTGDGCNAVQIYGKQSFDIVQACEVIEHLEKDRGPQLLEAITIVAKQIAIITTPNGFTFQDPAAHPEAPWAYNPYQKHLSGWTIDDFVALGWNVYANGGDWKNHWTGCQIVAWRQP